MKLIDLPGFDWRRACLGAYYALPPADFARSTPEDWDVARALGQTFYPSGVRIEDGTFHCRARVFRLREDAPPEVVAFLKMLATLAPEHDPPPEIMAHLEPYDEELALPLEEVAFYKLRRLRSAGMTIYKN